MVNQKPRKIEEKEDGGAPNEEEFSRKDNEEAFNISEFVSFLPSLYSPEMLLEGFRVFTRGQNEK